MTVVYIIGARVTGAEYVAEQSATPHGDEVAFCGCATYDFRTGAILQNNPGRSTTALMLENK